MNGQAELAKNQLRSAITAGSKALADVAKTGAFLSSQSTSTLVGTFGGFMGVALAYATSLIVLPASFAVLGPIGLGLGVTGSLLVYRATDGFKAEKAYETRQREAAAVLDVVKTLPKGAPAEFRTALLEEHQRLVLGRSPEQVEVKLLAAPSPENRLA